LGNEAEFGIGLGLDNNFAVRVIKAVGNYGEIYERNLGAESRLKIAPGLNSLGATSDPEQGFRLIPSIRSD
jgi:general L-amino acid transport system substrate-binding protein